MASSSDDARLLLPAGPRCLASWSFSLADYGPLLWTPVGGGFSGSRVWCGDNSSGPVLALKCWPATMTFERLAGIHAWMKQAEALPFVPRVLKADHGGTVSVEEGCAWDLTTWMKGEPSPLLPLCGGEVANATSDSCEGAFGILPAETPSPESDTAARGFGSDLPPIKPGERLKSACSAIAELHRAWRPRVSRLAPVPAVQRRLAILNGPVPNSLTHVVRMAKAALAPWVNLPLPIQPCLCDVHREHILFEGESVTGIVDYGAMKEDHVAVDLARYLGDVCGEDEEAFQAGLTSYGSLDVPSSFVRVLDRTGLVCALIGWELRVKVDSAPGRIAAQRVERLRARAASLRGI